MYGDALLHGLGLPGSREGLSRVGTRRLPWCTSNTSPASCPAAPSPVPACRIPAGPGFGIGPYIASPAIKSRRRIRDLPG